MTVKDALNEVSIADRKTLVIAFNDMRAHFVRFGDCMFVGVHLAGLPNLEIITQEGDWFVGRTECT